MFRMGITPQNIPQTSYSILSHTPISLDTPHPLSPPPELQGAQIIKNAIKLEQIEIIQFRLKI